MKSVFTFLLPLLLLTTSAMAATVETDGNTATAIRNLSVSGATYDVEFANLSSATIYGDAPVFDFSDRESARVAIEAVNAALNSATGLQLVGESSATGLPIFRIGFGVLGDGLSRLTQVWESVTDDVELDLWIRVVDPDVFPFFDDGSFAIFTLLSGTTTTTTSPPATTTSSTTTTTVSGATTTTTTTTLPPRVSQPLSGKQIDLIHNPKKAKNNKFVLKSDKGVVAPGVGNEPTVTGAVLSVGYAGGQRMTFNLPASGWKATNKGFEYKDKKQVNSACDSVVLQAGKTLNVNCKGAGVTIVPTLAQPIGVLLQMGSQTYCAAIVDATPTLTFQKNNKTTKVQGKKTPAPAQCFR